MVVVGLACSGLLLVLPAVALFLALSARSRTQAMERRLAELETELFELKRVVRSPAPSSAIRALPVPVPVASKPTPAPEIAPPVTETAKIPVESAAAAAPPVVAPVAVPAPVSVAVPARPAPPPSAPVRSPPPIAPPAPDAQPLRFERVAIWLLAGIAGVGLLFAAFLFYDIAVQRGFITPGVRYALGLVVGLALLVGAEQLWRRDYRIPAAAISGAGVGVLYTALYAGATRYELVGNLSTFALMAGVTGVATLLAVRHNSLMLALLGALGGYGTPIMLSTGENRAIALFGYLFLLNAGLVVASVRRRWAVLLLFAGLATLAIQLGWAFKFHAADQAPVGLAAPLVLGALFASAASRKDGHEHTAMAGGIASAGALLALMPYLIPVDASVEGGAALSETGLAIAGGAALLVAAAGLHALTAARGWGYLRAGLALLLTMPTLAYVGGWCAQSPPQPWLVGLVLLALPTLAWVRARGGPAPLLALGVSVLGSLVAAVLLEQGGDATGWGPALAMVAGLTVLGLSMGRTGLSGWAPLLTLAQASAILLLFEDTLGEAGLDGVTLGAGALIALVYLAAPFLQPASPEGEARPLGPWLASVLAGPAVFLQLYDAWHRSMGDRLIGALPVMLGLASLGALAALVRSRPRDPADRDLALYTAVALLFLAAAIPIQLSAEWITLGWALEIAALAWVRGRLTHPLLTPFALVLAAAVSARLLLNVDALDYHPVEGPVILNWITYTWGVPALCLLYAAPRLKGAPEGTDHALRVVAILMLFALVNLQVSHGFSSASELTFLSDDFTEEMTRSITWGGFGLALLVSGVLARSRVIRVVAFLFLLLAAAKVFLVDLGNLEGFARVGSLLGLSVFLLVAAVLYRWLDKGLDEENEERESQ